MSVLTQGDAEAQRPAARAARSRLQIALHGVRRNKNRTYVECRFISPEQKAKQQMLASIEMSGAPKGQRSVLDIPNIMHDMPSTLRDTGISARTAEAARVAKVAAWKVMLQDWRDVGPHDDVFLLRATLATPWRRALGPCRRTRRRRALVGRSHDDWKKNVLYSRNKITYMGLYWTICTRP
jgi:hypothetical protein